MLGGDVRPQQHLARRGVLAGTVLQALSISVPIGVPIFLVAVARDRQPRPRRRFLMAARSCFCRSPASSTSCGAATATIAPSRRSAPNLAGPIQESSALVALGLAVGLLGETLTPAQGARHRARPPWSGGRGRIGRKKTPRGRGVPRATTRFTPAYAEGYLFAALSATGYGTSPVLVRLGLDGAATSARASPAASSPISPRRW